jgi:uncharacterized protein YndB with AHSA1/START domain
VNLGVVLEEVLPHPVEAVWSALTDAAAISDWLMPTGDFRPVVGTRFRLKTQRLSSDGWVEAQVTELDPPRRMAWSWSVSNGLPPTTVIFELTPEREGTRLKLRHEGEIDPLAGGLLRDGWPGRLELLRRFLGGES